MSIRALISDEGFRPPAPLGGGGEPKRWGTAADVVDDDDGGGVEA